MELTPGELQEILKIFVDSELQELQLQVGEVTLAVSKNEAQIAGGVANAGVTLKPTDAPPAGSETRVTTEVPPPEAVEPVSVERPGLHALRSPLVGVFYRRPGPDQPSYVEVGDEVKPGDPVCTISVMKMFTEVGADQAGRVVEICVENETLVEHGQVLMYIEPIDS